MFKKNDNEFICINCGKKVEKLKYTSRDHCNHCLYSLHVDITPGDRENKCRGLLVPVNVEINSLSFFINIISPKLIIFYYIFYVIASDSNQTSNNNLLEITLNNTKNSIFKVNMLFFI